MTDDYDASLDAYLSWQLGIAEIRKLYLMAGLVEPINDAERNLVELFAALRAECEEKGKS